MRAVGLKVLKNRLSEYVRLAAAGETILVTDRERVVAELVPPSEGRSIAAGDAILADAVRKGWITPAIGPIGRIVPRQPMTSLSQLLDDLSTDRSDSADRGDDDLRR